VIKLGELVMILDLHRQGLSVSAIARQLGIDRKTVRAYIAKGLEPPVYKKRIPRGVSSRSAASSAATASSAIVYASCGLPDRQPSKCALKRQRVTKRKFDFARFEVKFVDEPGVKRQSLPHPRR